MSKISVLGTGTWGIALANLLSVSGHQVMAWSAIAEEIDYIQQYHKHPKLKDTHILESIELTKDLEEAMEGAEILLMAVPSVFVRSTSSQVAKYIKPDQIIVDVAKGIEAKTLKTMSEVIYEEINKVTDYDYGQIVALSGPTHAEEVSIGLPSTIVSACISEANAIKVQKSFSTHFMRVYTNSDIRGVEICGALKNIIALAAGIGHGLGYGDNATAALITRGITEVSRLGLALGCSMHTFFGLAGLGDMIVTCTSLHSRNNQCGILIGKGLSVEEAIKEVGMVVEGLNALDAGYELGKKYNVELPIINAVNDVVKNGLTPQECVENLFNRSYKAELSFDIIEKIYETSKTSRITRRILLTGTFNNIDTDFILAVKHLKKDNDYLMVGILGEDHYEIKKDLLLSLKDVDSVMLMNQEDSLEDMIESYHIDVSFSESEL